MSIQNQKQRQPEQVRCSRCGKVIIEFKTARITSKLTALCDDCGAFVRWYPQRKLTEPVA